MSELPANMEDKFNSYYLLKEEKYLFDKYVQGNVLDLCCGTGRIALNLHERGCIVRGYELNQYFVNTAKKRFPYLDIRQGNVENINEERLYDCVVCAYNSLGYTDVIKTIKNVEKALKPNGLFIFSALNIKWWILGSLLYTGTLHPLRGLMQYYKCKDRFAETVWATKDWWVKILDNFDLIETVLQNNNIFLSSRIHYVFRRKP